MLWKKESNRSDALFVDICEGGEYTLNLETSSMFDATKTMADKSDELASHYRKKGAEQCEAKAWLDAIELFNQALCFAENDSSELALIYADRSSCFFNLKMFDECMKDVKLAKANHCPQAIQPKLNRMIAMCGQRKQQQRKEEQITHQFKPTLSFKASQEFPIAANVIRFGTKSDSDRTVEATRDIPVGQTVLIEDGFVASTIETYKRCCICLKTTTNLVPCKSCTGSLFCPGTCEKSNLHSVECNAVFPDQDDYEDVDFGLVIRSILMAVQIVPNVNGLMRFVDRVLFVTIHPIRANEELTVSYLPEECLDGLPFLRRMMIRENFNIKCKCERCIKCEKAFSLSRGDVKLNQQFLDDIDTESHFQPKMQKMRKKLTQECVKYLNILGWRKWSEDLSLVFSTYIRLIQEKHYLNIHY